VQGTLSKIAFIKSANGSRLESNDSMVVWKGAPNSKICHVGRRKVGITSLHAEI
jgi:hypothetical protein